MKRTFTILQKVIVRTYYTENTSFFLLIIGLCCGFMSAVEHRALAELFISSPLTMLIPVSVWMIYTLKVVNFNASLLTRNENEFVFLFMLYPAWQKRILSWGVAGVQFMPAILYGSFLVSQALEHSLYLPVIITLSALLMLSILIGIILHRQLHNPNREKKISAWRRFINRNVTRPYTTFSLEWVSRHNPAMIIGAKVFASAILFGILKLYTTDTYDFRLLALGTVIAAGVSAQVIGEVHRFDTFHFTLPVQLPLSFARRFLNTLVCMALIFLPESGIIITYFPTYLEPTLIAESIVCMWALSYFWYAMLYQKSRTADTHTKIVFGSAMLWIVVALFSIPLWAIAIINFMMGVYLWKKYFFRYEAVSEQN